MVSKLAATATATVVWSGAWRLPAHPAKLAPARGCARRFAPMNVPLPDWRNVPETAIKLAATMTRIPVWNGQA